MEEKEFMPIDGNNTGETADYGINADENAAGTTHLNDPMLEESELERLSEQLEEQKDKYIRLFAEFDNFGAFTFALSFCCNNCFLGILFLILNFN